MTVVGYVLFAGAFFLALPLLPVAIPLALGYWFVSGEAAEGVQDDHIVT